jgi:BMFP domain-containing protein YqiC
MALIDLLARLASRPAGRVVEAPVRDLVQEALRGADLASPQQLQELRSQVMDANTELVTLNARVGALDERLARLLEENERLRARVHELEQPPEVKATPPAQDTPPVKTAPPAEPAAHPAARPAAPPSSTTCKLPDCDNKTRSKGFCQRHYRSWRAGDLPGFVGPEGLLDHRGQALRVDAEHQGRPVTVTGTQRLTVKVAGVKVDFDQL